MDEAEAEKFATAIYRIHSPLENQFSIQLSCVDHLASVAHAFQALYNCATESDFENMMLTVTLLDAFSEHPEASIRGRNFASLE